MIMVWIIVYIIGVTLFLWSLYLSGLHNEMCGDDYICLVIFGLSFPLSLPMLLVIRMSKLFQNSLRFMFHKIKKWREKNDS